MGLPERNTGSLTLQLLPGSGYRREPSAMSSDSQIAYALYDAQRVLDATPRKSLDEILVMAQQSSGWTQVFKQLKGEGLLEEQTLGHVVARWTNRPLRSRRPAMGAMLEWGSRRRDRDEGGEQLGRLGGAKLEADQTEGQVECQKMGDGQDGEPRGSSGTAGSEPGWLHAGAMLAQSHPAG